MVNFKNLLIIISISNFLLFLSCNEVKKRGIDSLIIENKLRWGMSYEKIEKLIKEDHDLTFFSKEQIMNNYNYMYVGGYFYGIQIKGLKLIFKDNAIEGIEIWINSNNKDEMEEKYRVLSGYFSKVATPNYFASNDAWMLHLDKGDSKKYETDIFMLQQKNKILIHIHKAYLSKESILIY